MEIKAMPVDAIQVQWKPLLSKVPGKGRRVAPFDGEVYLFGTDQHIVSARWVKSELTGKFGWDFMGTAACFPDGNLFWREVPSTREYGWVIQLEPLITIPENVRLIAEVLHGFKVCKWVEIYLDENGTLRRKLQPNLGDSGIPNDEDSDFFVRSYFLLPTIPKLNPNARIVGQPGPWT